jgi:hypothetical protein
MTTIANSRETLEHRDEQFNIMKVQLDEHTAEHEKLKEQHDIYKTELH